MIDDKIWADQAEFNEMTHGPRPETHVELTRVIKDFTLDLMTEVTEYLNAAQVFGNHRRPDEQILVNDENVRRQLIDIFKYWMILCQAHGFSREEMERTYWRKTATVRQRHTAEWLTQLAGPVVLVDLDGVLADFYEGFVKWIGGNPPSHQLERQLTLIQKLDTIRRTRAFVNAQSLGISIPEWETLNHQFRVQGVFGQLPMMPYAQQFIRWCRESYKCQVVAVTSRPIDKYPNIYDDTVEWFAVNQLHVDKIWWGVNKAEKLASVKHLIPEIRFAVDDDARYVTQFAEYGIPRVYWYNRNGHDPNPDWRTFKSTHIISVPNLNAIIELETKWYSQA